MYLLDTNVIGEIARNPQGDVANLPSDEYAIEFLVSSAEEIDFNRHTVLNLHALLANNLLAEPDSPGRLRHIAVGIQKSTFHPLEVPQLIEECFEQILATSAAIRNPFEQSFFLTVQRPYRSSSAWTDGQKLCARVHSELVSRKC